MEVKKHYAYFSAAIRDGAKLNEQTFGVLYLNGRTCAIGAGATAMGFADIGEAWQAIVAEFPYLGSAQNRTECPAKPCSHPRSRPVYATITHLNDDHRWTREQIADWLYAEEEKLGFVTLTEAHNTPEAGRGDSVDTKAQSGVFNEKVFV